MDKSTGQRLTKVGLELHEKSLALDTEHRGMHAENVVRAEQVRAFHQELGKAVLKADRRNGITELHRSNCLLDLSAGPLSMMQESQQTPQPDQLDQQLKLFAHLGKPSGDDPVERFFTPGDTSDPTCYAKQALADFDTPFGDGQTVDNRKAQAKLNVAIVKSRSKKNKKGRAEKV